MLHPALVVAVFLLALGDLAEAATKITPALTKAAAEFYECQVVNASNRDLTDVSIAILDVGGVPIATNVTRSGPVTSAGGSPPLLGACPDNPAEARKAVRARQEASLVYGMVRTLREWNVQIRTRCRPAAVSRAFVRCGGPEERADGAIADSDEEERSS